MPSLCHILTFLLLSASLLTIVSCSDDEVDVPSYITDFIVAQTNSKGEVSNIIFDNGAEYSPSKQTIHAQAADSAYRCIAVYAREKDDYVFYSIEPVFSSYPVEADSFKVSRDSLPHDPVKLTSIWQGNGFLNMHLGVMTTGNGTHRYAFCIDSVKGDTEYVSLIHQRPKGDAESYTDKIYMSMPMEKAEEGVARFVFRVNTYDGWKTYEF